MGLLDVMTSPWAIQPEKLREIKNIYMTHLRGEKIDLQGIEAMLGKPLNNEAKRYSVVGNTAIVPIEGVLAKKMNLFNKISGGMSLNILAKDLKEIAADASVKAVILSIDSPGGAVDGTPDVAQIVTELRKTKRVVAHTTGSMASGAYWIGAAAGNVFISSDVTQVGSIGVVCEHVDVSAADAQGGIKRTEITAGKYKRIASSYAPLTEAGKQSLQDMVDYIYSAFVNNVAMFRGVSVDKVLSDMADGRIYIGRQAIQAGLVDGVATLDQLVTAFNTPGAVFLAA